MIERPELTDAIIRAALAVHRTLGPGLSSHIYRRALAIECNVAAALAAVEEREIEVRYRGKSVGKQRIDLLVSVLDGPMTVSELVVVEVKHLHPLDTPRIELARSQCQTYLALANVRVGLVLNFGAEKLIPRRVVNPHVRPATTTRKETIP